MVHSLRLKKESHRVVGWLFYRFVRFAAAIAELMIIGSVAERCKEEVRRVSYDPSSH